MYIPGRCVEEYLRSIDLIKQYCKMQRKKRLVIGVDARKVFDSVNHIYMQGILEAYGFGQNVLTLLCVSTTYLPYIKKYLLAA